MDTQTNAKHAAGRTVAKILSHKVRSLSRLITEPLQYTISAYARLRTARRAEQQALLLCM